MRSIIVALCVISRARRRRRSARAERARLALGVGQRVVFPLWCVSKSPAPMYLTQWLGLTGIIVEVGGRLLTLMSRAGRSWAAAARAVCCVDVARLQQNKTKQPERLPSHIRCTQTFVSCVFGLSYTPHFGWHIQKSKHTLSRALCSLLVSTTPLQSKQSCCR